MPADPDQALRALRASVERLRSGAERFAPGDLARMSYAKDWTIAQVLSHLGSGAVIMRHQIGEALGGDRPDPSFAQGVWDEWNAKPPERQAADALVADASLIERLDAVTDDERARFELALGPFQLDFAGVIRMRLNEHALHSWDIAAASDPAARLAPDAVAIVIDNLDIIARFGAKPDGQRDQFDVVTTEPDRRFRLELAGDTASLTPTDPGERSNADLELPAEAFIRLVYGRLDPAHMPADVTSNGGALDKLRRTYAGV